MSPAEPSACAGYWPAKQPVDAVPVRSGGPPATAGAWAAWPAGVRATDVVGVGVAADPEITRRVPAIVSTLPARPVPPTLGVCVGNARVSPPDLYSVHEVPNSFCALPIEIVAVICRWVTSAFAVTP